MSYKGAFLNSKEAQAAGKYISYVPSSDGNVYRITDAEFGVITTPACNISVLDDIKPSFRSKLPKIPYIFLEHIISFFNYCCHGFETPMEAIVQIFWDREEKRYLLIVPQQKISYNEVVCLNPELDEDRYLHYADIHSHNTMPAVFSKQDDRDDRAIRIYVVIGRLDNPFPEIRARVSNGCSYLTISASDIFETNHLYYMDVSEQWKKNLIKYTENGKEEFLIPKVFISEVQADVDL